MIVMSEGLSVGINAVLPELSLVVDCMSVLAQNLRPTRVRTHDANIGALLRLCAGNAESPGVIEFPRSYLPRQSSSGCVTSRLSVQGWLEC